MRRAQVFLHRQRHDSSPSSSSSLMCSSLIRLSWCTSMLFRNCQLCAPGFCHGQAQRHRVDKTVTTVSRVSLPSLGHWETRLAHLMMTDARALAVFVDLMCAATFASYVVFALSRCSDALGVALVLCVCVRVLENMSAYSLYGIVYLSILRL